SRAVATRQHAHPENGLVAAALRIHLVVVVRVEIVRSTGIAHEIGAGERAADELRRLVSDIESIECGCHAFSPRCACPFRPACGERSARSRPPGCGTSSR